MNNSAITDAISNSITNVNSLIDAVEDLNSKGTKDLFATAKLNAEAVSEAVVQGNPSAIKFDNLDELNKAVNTKAPTDISAEVLGAAKVTVLPEVIENDAGRDVQIALGLEDFEVSREYIVERLTVDGVVPEEAAVDAAMTAANSEFKDKRESYTFEIFNVEGSDGNLFEIERIVDSTDNNEKKYVLQLKETEALDFESSSHQSGVYSVWVKGYDDVGKSIIKEIKIQATDVNEAPILSEKAVTAQEDVSFSYVIPATDPEGDDLTFSVVSELPSWLEFSSSTGTLFGTPTNADVGVYSISVSMTDSNSLTSTETLTVTVENVNDDPEFKTTPTREVTQGQAYSTVFEVSDVDNEASDLKVTLNEEISADWLSFDPETNTLSGTPSSSDVSTQGVSSSVSMTVSDGSGGSELLSFDIFVSNVNDSPEIAAITVASVTEGAPGETVASEGISGTIAVTDPDTGFVEETVTVSLEGATDNVKAGAYGSLTFDPTDNSYVYTPDEAAIGALTEGQAVADEFNFIATDSSSATGSAVFTVNVTGANDKPVITVGDDDLSELSDLSSGARVGLLTASDDTDSAADISYALTSASNANDNASFEIVDGNMLKLKDDVVTNRSEKSSYSVEIVATDSGALASEAKTLTLSVSSVNSAPAVTEISVDVESGTLAVGDEINFTALVNEAVNEGSSFTVTLSNGATFDMNRSATSKITFNGTYTVAAGDDVNGNDVLSISSYSSGSVVEDNYAENGSPQALKSSDNTITIGTVKIDATPPTATLDASGHTYNASTGTLALKGADFGTMGVSDGGSVKEILDFTKLTWNVDGQNSVTMVMSVSDISTAVATDSSNLSIVLTSTAQENLHNLSGFGGSADTGGTADVINFDIGFLRDAAGNASSTQNALNANVAMTDTASPTYSSFLSSTVGDAILLGVGDAIAMNLTFNEALRADSTASIVLSNGGTVQLTVSGADAKVLTGDYVVSIDDDDVRGSDSITLSSMPLFTVADISGNILSSPGVDSVDASSLGSIEIDATPPEATIANAGHQYDASTGVLTLVGTNLTTLLDDPSVTNVVAQLDFTKLTWNVDVAGSVTMAMAADDITSAVVTNATTLTIALSTGGKTDLHALAGFGGTASTGGTADGIDVAVGFLNDAAGNGSSSQSSPIAAAEVTLNDVTAPTISTITSTPGTAGAFGVGDKITFTAQLSENIKNGSSMSITLSNDATVTLTGAGSDTVTGDYVVDSEDSDSDGLSIANFAVNSLLDISGNSLSANLTISTVDNITANTIDTTSPRVLISQFLNSSSEMVVAFNEAVTDSSIDALEAALRGLDAIADDASISTSDNITAKIAVNNSVAIPNNNILDVVDFVVEDLTGNVLTITTLDIA
ncbi:putative Ig domain-containing protein [Planktomarina sp.]|nr:putative Ig domain-containing protein [Planktomarina sp.]